MLLLHDLLLLFDFGLQPAHGNLHGRHLAHHAAIFAAAFPGLQFLLNPLLLLRHQVPSLSVHLLLGFLPHDLRLLHLFLPLFCQRDLGIFDVLLLCQGIAGATTDVGIAETAQQGQADVGLFEGTDVVPAVSTHQCMHILNLADGRDDLLFLVRRQPGIDLNHMQLPANALLRRLHGQLQRMARDNEVILLAQLFHTLWLEWKRCDGGVGLVGDGRSPLQRAGLALLLEYQGVLRRELADANLVGNAQGCERRISSEHHALVLGVLQRLDDQHRIRPRLALEGDEPCERHFALARISGLLPIGTCCAGVAVQKLVCQAQHALPLLSHRTVGCVVPIRLRRAQLGDGLGGALGQAIRARRDARDGRDHFADGAHALELGREVEARLDGDLESFGLQPVDLELLLEVIELLLDFLLLFLVCLHVVLESGHELLLAGHEPLLIPPSSGRGRAGARHVTPSDAADRCNFDGVAERLALNLDQGVAASDHHGSHRGCLLCGAGRLHAILDLSLGALAVGAVDHADGYHLVGGQSASLVKEAIRDAARVGYTEGFCAENADLQQAHEGSVHRECHLHGQRWRHHGRDDERAPEKRLVGRLGRVLQALLQHVACSSQGEDQQEKQLGRSLDLVGCHLLSRKLDHAHQLALGRVEAGAHDVADDAVVRGAHRVWLLVLPQGLLRGGDLDERGAAEERVDTVLAEGIDRDALVRDVSQFVLHLGHRLASKSRLVDDRTALEQQTIARHDDVLVASVFFHLRALCLRFRTLDHERHDVARQQFLDRPLFPFALPEHVDIVALRAHAAQLGHRLQSLESSRSFEAEDGQQREASVLPIRVKHPQRRAAKLENGQGCHELLLEQIHERRPGKLEDIRAEPVLSLFDLGGGLNPARTPVLAPAEVRGAADEAHAGATAVAQQLLGDLLVGVDHLVHLVLEGEVESQRHFGFRDHADGCLALVGMGRDPCKAAKLETIGRFEKDGGLEANRPMAHQVEKDVHGDGEESEGTSPRIRQQLRRQGFLIDLEFRLLAVLLSALEAYALLLELSGLLLQGPFLLSQSPLVGLT
mmetsp:Transcript_18395/g.64622  ORF Transcript_18395/g.64622 Transcript_18395/m.64622 type:complete len:1055 (+) Transcript_18395:1510-4674(+)